MRQDFAFKLVLVFDSILHAIVHNSSTRWVGAIQILATVPAFIKASRKILKFRVCANDVSRFLLKRLQIIFFFSTALRCAVVEQVDFNIRVLSHLSGFFVLFHHISAHYFIGLAKSYDRMGPCQVFERLALQIGHLE